MQIHELNPFDGELNSAAFLAVDDGTDTGKISTQMLLADTEGRIADLDDSLNARIDNIIAGGAAPSEAEVTDARHGADELGAVDYNSLGAAIRGQADLLARGLSSIPTRAQVIPWVVGKYADDDTGHIGSNSWAAVSKCPLEEVVDMLVLNDSTGGSLWYSVFAFDNTWTYAGVWDPSAKTFLTTAVQLKDPFFFVTQIKQLYPTYHLFIKLVKVGGGMSEAITNDLKAYSLEDHVIRTAPGDVITWINGTYGTDTGDYGAHQTGICTSRYVPDFVKGILTDGDTRVQVWSSDDVYIGAYSYDRLATDGSTTYSTYYELDSIRSFEPNCKIKITAFGAGGDPAHAAVYTLFIDEIEKGESVTDDLKSFDVNTQDTFEDLIGVMSFRNTVYNGTATNPADSRAVCTGASIFKDEIDNYIHGAKKVRLITDRPNRAGCQYLVSYTLYDVDKNWISTSGYDANNYDNDISVPNGAYWMAWSIFEADADGVAQTIRVSDFDGYKVNTQKIYKDQTEIGEEGEVVHKLRNARNLAINSDNLPLTLLHFSDLHADANALYRIVSFAESNPDLVDDIICTGDMVAGTYASITSWWDPKVMTCIGNHDCASYDPDTGYDWTALSMADRDAYYIAPFESNWDIMHTSGTSYYYKDYTDQKVRLIVMDDMLYNDNGAEATAQTAWLASLLADAITNGYHVIIGIHAPHGGSELIRCSFTFYDWNSPMPTRSDCNTPQTVIDTVANAITNGLHFVGYIVGHIHQDFVWDAENDKSQLMYAITTANTNTEAQWEMSGQDRSEDVDAFNLVTIDTNRTLVKIIRGGGADIDNHMRTRKAICFNYSTGEITGEVL